jgi:cytochrome d ubiquinol oxidase subunit I
MFTVVYALLFALFIYLLDKKIRNGPESHAFVEHRPHLEDISDVVAKPRTKKSPH